MATVNIYRVTKSGDVHTYCTKCAKNPPEEIEYIDKAADWDECELCLSENVPAGYQPTHHPRLN